MFHSKILSPKIGTVTVEYSKDGERVQKTFPKEPPAKRFYREQLRLGNDPRIVKAILS